VADDKQVRPKQLESRSGGSFKILGVGMSGDINGPHKQASWHAIQLSEHFTTLIVLYPMLLSHEGLAATLFLPFRAKLLFLHIGYP